MSSNTTRLANPSSACTASKLEPWLELLAYQFERANTDDDRQKAIAYLRAAAAQAQARLANDQAATLYRRALELAAQVVPPDPHLRCELLIDVGNAERGPASPRHAARCSRPSTAR